MFNSFQEPRKHKFFNRSSSLKQSANRTIQASLDLTVSGQPSSATPAGTLSHQQPSTPKKSNWEVIEHFNTNTKGGKAVVSSSLIAVSTNEKKRENEIN